MAEAIKVGMAELVVAHNPAQLTTIGLGSCVGIVLYDRISKIGGLAHIMLPNSKLFKSDKTNNKAKFADTAISEMLDKMLSLGAQKRFIRAKIFGGANMFHSLVSSKGLIDMGTKNSQMVKQELQKLKIKLESEELGGNFGRTITLNTETGIVHLRTMTGEVREY